MTKETNEYLAKCLMGAWTLLYRSEDNDGDILPDRMIHNIRIDAGDEFEAVYRIANEQWRIGDNNV